MAKWKNDHLAHFGIKGQKWGVQNGPPYPLDSNIPKQMKTYSIRRKGSSEKHNISFEERPTPAFARFISQFFPSVKDNIQKDKQFNIVVDGKRVGDLEIYRESKNSLNVVWVGVDKSERGKGYASATMKGVVEYAKLTKCRQITLEVPGNSPDARHIYEKLGFKTVKTISDEDDVWGGLTAMKLKL